MHRPPASIIVRPAGQCFPELLHTSRLDRLPAKVGLMVASYLAACTLVDLARLNTKRLAQELNYTRSYLSSKFKREEKVSLHEAILDEKLRRAQMLLTERSANHSVRVVCRMVGYSTPRHFQKIFQKRTGLRPSEFRHTHVEMPAARPAPRAPERHPEAGIQDT